MRASSRNLALAGLVAVFSVPALAAETAKAHAKAAPAAEGVSVENAASAPATAGTGKSCEEVKAQIDAKIKAKGVKAFSLDVVGKDEVKDAKVVGSCENGRKKITYKRG